MKHYVLIEAICIWLESIGPPLAIRLVRYMPIVNERIHKISKSKIASGLKRISRYGRHFFHSDNITNF